MWIAGPKVVEFPCTIGRVSAVALHCYYCCSAAGSLNCLLERDDKLCDVIR